MPLGIPCSTLRPFAVCLTMPPPHPRCVKSGASWQNSEAGVFPLWRLLLTKGTQTWPSHHQIGEPVRHADALLTSTMGGAGSGFVPPSWSQPNTADDEEHFASSPPPPQAV